MCGGVCVCRAPPTACVLMFWFSRDVSGWGVGVFPPADDGVQVRSRLDTELDAIQTGESYGYGQSGEKREIQPCEVKHQADKARSRTSLTFSRFQPLSHTEGEAGDEERHRVDLLSVGQVGAKHRRLAC